MLTEKDLTKINNYLVAIRALCEAARNENTDSIIQILYDIEKITVREEGEKRMAKDKMKAWYDDIDAATLQRIKTYSAFNDATSKNLMMQTMYEYREKEIQDFKETNHELAETCIARKKQIAELEKENAELKAKIYGGRYEAIYTKLNADIFLLEKQNKEFKNKLAKAKEIILKLYNAGRDVLMCRAEEKAYDNLSEAINDRSIEQFLSGVGHE